MNTIKCPKCGEVFSVDENSYALILKQVRDEEFSKEVKEKLGLYKEAHEKERELAVSEARQESESTIAKLEEELRQFKLQRESERELERRKYESDMAKMRSEFQSEQNVLKQKLFSAEKEKELAVKNEALMWQEKLSGKEKEVQEEKNRSLKNQYETDLKVSAQKEKYELEIKSLNDQVSYWKDLKKKMSTKMVGESLEQYCSDEFNKLRAAAFPRAYFEKDNDLNKGGTKGDFIFRDYPEGEEADEGTELLSIMFEMKNENEETASKHKNEDFLAKLDKDRRDKGCEYAVLVSLLEADSELYDQGIVDMSYKYPKMYVIRPQFFIPLITILKNAAQKNADLKKEIILAKAQNLDVTNFEKKLQEAKDKIAKNALNAEAKFNAAIEDIDKAIKKLKDIKDNLISSLKYAKRADAVMEDLTIRKLTYGNKTMAEQFKAAAESGEANPSDPALFPDQEAGE